MNNGYKPVSEKTLADVQKANDAAYGKSTFDAIESEFKVGQRVRPSNNIQMNLKVPVDTETWKIISVSKLRDLKEPGNKAFGIRPKYGTAFRYEIESSSGVRGWANPEQLENV